MDWTVWEYPPTDNHSIWNSRACRTHCLPRWCQVLLALLAQYNHLISRHFHTRVDCYRQGRELRVRDTWRGHTELGNTLCFTFKFFGSAQRALAVDVTILFTLAYRSASALTRHDITVCQRHRKCLLECISACECSFILLICFFHACILTFLFIFMHSVTSTLR